MSGGRRVAAWARVCAAIGVVGAATACAAEGAALAGGEGERLAGAVRWIMTAWAAAIGACVGSFLNVVVYRLPQGMNLSRPASHCPNCRRAIAWYDNVPVLGWVRLKGRCRWCGEPFSVRYPLVEAALGVAVGGLAVLEFLYPGASLPARGASELPDAALAAAVFSHGALIATLLGAALMAADGASVPGRLYALIAGCGVLAPLVWPALRPLTRGSSTATDAVATIALAALVALTVGPYRGRLAEPSRSAPLFVVGLALGPITALAAALGAGLLAWVDRLARPQQRLPWIGHLLLATTAALLAWRTWWQAWGLDEPERNAWAWLLVVPVIVVHAVMPATAKRKTTDRTAERPGPESKKRRSGKSKPK